MRLGAGGGGSLISQAVMWEGIRTDDERANQQRKTEKNAAHAVASVDAYYL